MLLVLQLKFQFQTGSIRSKIKPVQDKLRECFNSKLVRLEVCLIGYLRFWNLGFNSKLVRLEVPMYMQAERFLKSFNSKLVRLEGRRFAHARYPTGVSIPNWFD